MTVRVAISTPRAGWGGSAAVGASLASGLQERGHRVVVFCKPDSEIHRGMGDHLTYEPVLYGVDFPPPAIWRCRKAFRRHGIQIVLSLLRMDLRLTAAAARLSGLRVLAHRAELEPFSRLPHNRFLLDRLPHHWVAPSEASRRLMLRTGPWLESEEVTTIHNGIDPAPFERAEPARLDLPPDAVAVGFVGRLVVEKGLPELAAAWRQVVEEDSRLHLVIAGSGDAESFLRKELGDAPRVRWLGFRTDMPAVMRALDLVAVPSWMESFGLVAVEAMAAGTPVVAARVGGLAEIVVEGKTGLLVPSRDPEALAGAILRLGRNPETRNRMGHRAMDRIREHFHEDRMIDAYEELLVGEVLGAGD